MCFHIIGQIFNVILKFEVETLVHFRTLISVNYMFITCLMLQCFPWIGKGWSPLELELYLKVDLVVRNNWLKR